MSPTSHLQVAYQYASGVGTRCGGRGKDPDPGHSPPFRGCAAARVLVPRGPSWSSLVPLRYPGGDGTDPARDGRGAGVEGITRRRFRLCWRSGHHPPLIRMSGRVHPAVQADTVAGVHHGPTAACGRRPGSDPRADPSRLRRLGVPDRCGPHRRGRDPQDRRARARCGPARPPAPRPVGAGGLPAHPADRRPHPSWRASSSATRRARSRAPMLSDRQVRAVLRRHAVPRRGRRYAAGDAGQGPPAAAGSILRAGRRQRDDPDRRAADRGDEPRPGGGCGPRQIPPRPVLSPGRLHDPTPPLARAGR